MFARVCAVCLALGLVGLIGCGPGKLDVNKTVTVEATEYNLTILSKQSQVQNITVEFDSPTEINVLVADAGLENSFANLSPEKQTEAGKYGKKLNAKQGTLTAEIPANTEVMVAVGGANKKADVKLSISNRK